MIVTDPVREYLHELHRPAAEDSLLRDMYVHARRDSIPVVMPGTGALLETLALSTGAKRTVEVGTAIGVSTLRLARGGTSVISFEIDAERQRAAREYLTRGGVADRVDLRLQDATEGIGQLEGPFDLAFIDGPKALYCSQIDSLLPLLRPGGLLIIDNTLLSGTVATQEPRGHWSADKITDMRHLNQWLLENKNFVATVTPVGDGVTLAVRR